MLSVIVLVIILKYCMLQKLSNFLDNCIVIRSLTMVLSLLSLIGSYCLFTKMPVNDLLLCCKTKLHSVAKGLPLCMRYISAMALFCKATEGIKIQSYLTNFLPPSSKPHFPSCALDPTLVAQNAFLLQHPLKNVSVWTQLLDPSGVINGLL